MTHCPVVLEAAPFPPGCDHYVRVDTADYSVDPAAIGGMVTVRCGSYEVIVLAWGGEIVPRRPRCWARRQNFTGPHQFLLALAPRN